MIKAKIFTAMSVATFIFILCFATLFFVPVNKFTNGFLLINEHNSYIVFKQADANYILSRDILSVDINFGDEGYTCGISLYATYEKKCIFDISLPSAIYTNFNYAQVNVKIDSINFYKYIFFN